MVHLHALNSCRIPSVLPLAPLLSQLWPLVSIKSWIDVLLLFPNTCSHFISAVYREFEWLLRIIADTDTLKRLSLIAKIYVCEQGLGHLVPSSSIKKHRYNHAFRNASTVLAKQTINNWSWKILQLGYNITNRSINFIPGLSDRSNWPQARNLVWKEVGYSVTCRDNNNFIAHNDWPYLFE